MALQTDWTPLFCFTHVFLVTFQKKWTCPLRFGLDCGARGLMFSRKQTLVSFLSGLYVLPNYWQGRGVVRWTQARTCSEQCERGLCMLARLCTWDLLTRRKMWKITRQTVKRDFWLDSWANREVSRWLFWHVELCLAMLCLWLNSRSHTVCFY